MIKKTFPHVSHAAATSLGRFRAPARKVKEHFSLLPGCNPAGKSTALDCVRATIKSVVGA